jgi:Uma2 family endonuclease
MGMKPGSERGTQAMALNNTIHPAPKLSPMVLHWPASMRLDNQQFYEFCRANRDLRIERTATGDHEIMAPTGGETSWRNSHLITLLSIWADHDGSGVVFDSSGGFVLPNGAIRSPDASWVRKSRLAPLSKKQKQGFLPLCPDFVIELRSSSDSLPNLQAKLREYIENGAGLGWLIDPEDKRVYVFKPDQAMSAMENPEYLLGGDLLKGFKLRMEPLWEAAF